MVDFSQFLKKPAGQAKKPAALPVGDYPGVIKTLPTTGDQNKNKTPYVRFELGLTDWPESIPQEDREGHDLSKKNFRRDFYITDDALYMLDAFIRSCGIEPNDRPYEEILPELVGAPVLISVEQYMNQNSSSPNFNELGNQVNKVVGLK